jgi:hypothetical protein
MVLGLHFINRRQGTQMRFRCTTSLLAIALAAVAIARPASAQGSSGQLPAAKDLVARHVAAIGGREALMARRSVQARGTFEMPAMGVRGEFQAAQSREGAMVMKVTVPGLGEMQSGYNGNVAWALNPMTGPRLLTGRELSQTRDEANMSAVLREPPSIASIETVEVSTMGGEHCYKVRVTWASGRSTFDCYSVESDLLIGTQSALESSTGALDIATTMSEYRDFGGVKVATVMTQRAAGQEQVLRITGYELDSVDARVFDLPPAIAELTRQQPATPGR